MMYNEKLAVAIKSAGKVLRENKDTVYLPFGSEYSIFIKNLNSVRALVKVSIDGQYVDGDGSGIAINANSSLDLERFIKNHNLSSGNRFKFIERIGKVEQHRGVQVEDGLIRVEFQYEKRAPKVEVEEVHHYKRHYWHDDYWWYEPYRGGRIYRSFSDPRHSLIGTSYDCFSSGGMGVASGGGVAGSSDGAMVNLCQVSGSGTLGASAATETLTTTSNSLGGDPIEWAETEMKREMPNDAGITVAGSRSDQQFHIVDDFPLEETSHVIVLKLLGTSAKGVKIQRPITVKSKPKCTTCGHQNKANAKFCTECGTALEIV